MAKNFKPNDPDQQIPTRHSLLSRLKDWDDKDSWRLFFENYWRLIYGVAKRAGLSDDEAQDVVQETVLSVARQMPGFKYDPKLGSFKGWLLNLTRWRIADQLRKRKRANGKLGVPHPDPESGTPLLERIPDPAGNELEMIWDEEWQRNLIDIAVDKAKQTVNPKYYQIFDLNVFKGWPVQRIAQTLNIHVAQVYLAKHRVARQIKKQVRLLQNQIL